MSIRIRRRLLPLSLMVAVLGAPALAAAQPKDGFLSGNIKYSTGQSVQPIYEGWTRNPDGSYQIYFGYLNRNHVENVQVPVGPNNRIEPAGPDRGQPTYFYPRFNRQLFAVTVPADWGKKEVVWTLVVHGQTERAVGWLRPDWEIAPPLAGTGTGRGGQIEQNRPPTLTVSGAARIAVSSPLTLTATVTDDGLPVPRGRGARGGGAGANRPPAFDNSEFKATPPVNVPQVERPAPARISGRLQVTWFVWRGPAPVAFDPPGASADAGSAVITASFTQPGEYVLRARATDSAATALQDLKVVVTAP